MELWKQISLLVVLFVIGCLMVIPVIADEEPVEDSPVILDVQDGDTFTIEDMTWLDWFHSGSMVIIVAVVMFMAYQQWHTGGDPALAGFIGNVQQNRPVIDQGERWYQQQPQQFQMTFKNIGELMTFIGSTTTLKAPGELGELMKDIQVPGPPEDSPQAEPEATG